MSLGICGDLMKPWRFGEVWRKHSLFRAGIALVVVLSMFGLGCRFRLPALGKAGQYRTAYRDLTQPGGSGVRRAIPILEDLVKDDPFYPGALTLLGRAYYQLGKYGEAEQLLQRAVLVDKEDEIAWTILGMAQLRLGQDQKGLESYKGGLSLLYKKATKYDYRGYVSWDRNNLVRSAIRKAIFQVQKDGLENKDRMIRYGELIIFRIDDEVGFQKHDAFIEEVREMGDDDGGDDSSN